MLSVNQLSGFGVASSSVFSTPSAKWADVKLLMHFENNYTESRGLCTVSLRSGVNFSSSVKKFGSYSLTSPYNGYVQIAPDTDLKFEGDFTIEFWWYPDVDTMSGANIVFFMYGSTGDYLQYYNGAWNVTNAPIGASPAPTPRVWQHIALVRSGAIISLYIDGVSTGTVVTRSNAFGSNTTILKLFNYAPSPVYGVVGYVDELRITAAAVYTTNFTPPSSAFPNS